MRCLQKTTGFELYTLELVVQVGAIRQWTDKTHMVSCNYELGGQQSSSSKITKDRSVSGFYTLIIWSTCENVTNECSDEILMRFHDLHN